MKVLLLNPPGQYLYVRDCYCNKVSKTGLAAYPMDLLVISGILKKHNVPVIYKDANSGRLSVKRTLEFIKKENFSHIIMLMSSVSLEDDTAFLKELRKFFKGVIFVSGDIVFAPAAFKEKFKGLIDIYIKDFTSFQIISVLKAPAAYTELSYEEKPEFSYYIPCYEQIRASEYFFPFARHKNTAFILSNYGCPYNCSFCMFSNIKFKERNKDDFENEIKFLKNRRGVKEIYLADQIFGVEKSGYKEIAEILKKNGLIWSCFIRINDFNEEKIKFFKQTGCHTVMFGVETPVLELREKYSKNIKDEVIDENTSLFKKYKIKTAALYIIGFPEDTKESVLKTIDYSVKLNTDYASFNIASPKFSTAFEHYINDKEKGFAQSGREYNMKTVLTAGEINTLYKTALKKFYLRWGYIYKKIRNLSSLSEFKSSLSIFFNIIKNIGKS